MIKPIVHDQQFLSQKSIPATKSDKQTVLDLIDTLKAHEDNCVGMAANMIGIQKDIIVFKLGVLPVPMINPTIIGKNSSYTTQEGCLSLTGQRKTTRYQNITVKYFDISFTEHTQKFEGFVAQIIQHEIDHCNGIVI